MKKTIQAIFSLIFGTLTLQAQTPITILQADMPKSGDTVRYSTVTSANFNFAKTAADTTWDFSSLTPDFQDVERFYAPMSTSYILYFNALNSTYGQRDKMPGINFGGFSSNMFENVMSFYKSSAAALVMVGRGATVQSLPIGITYNPKDTVYKFPLAYKNHDSCVFKGSASLASIGGIAQVGKRITDVDGWGKIKVPAGTFDCIRVKSVVTEVDTITLSGQSIPLPNTRTEYRWLTKTGKIPVLEVVVPKNPLLGQTTIKFKDINRPDLFKSYASYVAVPTSAKINKDTVKFTSNCPGIPISYAWTFTPATVTYVNGTSASSANPQVVLNATGNYSVNLHVVYEGGSDDSLHTNYLTGTANTGSQELKPLQLSMYPVPAKNVVYIESNKAFDQTSIQVMDITGKEIHLPVILTDIYTAQLDVSSLVPGVYFVQTHIHNQTTTARFVKE